MVVENAFGRLTGRWKCLLKRLDIQMKNATTVVGARVVLHNICETFGDHFQEDWECTDDIDTEDNKDNATHERQSGGRSAVAIRNTILQFLNNTNLE